MIVLKDEFKVKNAGFSADGHWLSVWATGGPVDRAYFWSFAAESFVEYGQGDYEKVIFTNFHTVG